VTLLRVQQGSYGTRGRTQTAGRMDGLESPSHAKYRDPNFPIIYMNRGRCRPMALAWRPPNSRLRTKPFAPAQLVTAVVPSHGGHATR